MRTGIFVAGAFTIAASLFTAPASAQVLECIPASAGGSGYASVHCPAGHPYATGGVFWSWSGGVNAMSPWGGFVAYDFEADFSGDGTVTASCCNKAAGTSEVHSTTNVATASCGAANLVGGGGYCDDPTAKITFSHPLPYATGSTPTQWTVRCSKNGVWAVANCSIQDAYDSCRVQRTVNASGKIASADCFSNEVATSTGVWCGSGSFSGGNFSSNMNTITVGCSQNDTHAFAICCDGAGP